MWQFQAGHQPYQLRHEEFVSYHQVVLELANRFKGFYNDHILHLKNMLAYTPTALVAILALLAQTGQPSGYDFYYL